jgi:DNA mismatch endonuclease, patch repair protein
MDRGENMQRIRSKDTTPELHVRKLLFSLGFRYRIHRKDLPGNPDIVFPARKRVIFVHGCFWHPHQPCRISHVPRSNQAYWLPKLEGNLARDRAALKALRELGWKTLVLRECQVKSVALEGRLRRFLSDGR